MKSSPLESTVALEWRVVQALCQITPGDSLRRHARRILEGYRWHEPSYQVIFEALITLSPNHPATLQEQLTAQLTRRGFPDLACEDLFQGSGLSQTEAEKLMRRLRESQ